MNQQSEQSQQSVIVIARSINNVLQKPMTAASFGQQNNPNQSHCRICNKVGSVVHNGVCSHCRSRAPQVDEFQELMSAFDLFRENYTKLGGAIDKEVDPQKLQQLNQSVTWVIHKLQGTKSQILSQLFKNPSPSNVQLQCPKHMREIIAVCIDPLCSYQPSSCLGCLDDRTQHQHNRDNIKTLNEIRQKLKGIQTTYTGLLNINKQHQQLTTSLIGIQKSIEDKLSVSLDKFQCMSQIDYLLIKCNRSMQDNLNNSPQLSSILQKDNGFIIRFDPKDDALTKTMRRMETILKNFTNSMALFQRDMDEIKF